MKRLNLKHSIVIVCLLLNLMLVGCRRNEAISELESTVYLINQQYEMSFGYSMDMDSMFYDKEKNNVELILRFDEDNAPIDFEKIQNHKKTLKQTFNVIFSDSENPKLMELLDLVEELEASWTIRCESADGTKQVAVSYTKDELKDVFDNPLTERQKYELILKGNILIENVQRSPSADDMFPLRKVYDAGNYVIYVYHVDESVLKTIKLSKASFTKALKQRIAQLIADSTFKIDVDVLTKLGKGLKFRFESDDPSADGIYIVFPVDELRDFLAN